MKNAKNIAIGVLAIGVLAIVGQMCGAIGSVSETVQVMPDELAGAAATRTAIAPAIVPTVRYNEVVLPTQQAVESVEIVNTTKIRYDWDRFWIVAKGICKIAVLASVTLLGVTIALCASIGAIVLIVCFLIERAKRAYAYEPMQRLPDSALYFPQRLMLTDPRSGLTWKVTTYQQASVEHGTLLIERINGKGVRFKLGNGERHLATIEALQSG